MVDLGCGRPALCDLHRDGQDRSRRAAALAAKHGGWYAYANARTLRFADGPDEVHRNAIAKMELGKYSANPRPVEMPITRGR